MEQLQSISQKQAVRNASDCVAYAAWEADFEGENAYVAALKSAQNVICYASLFPASPAVTAAIQAANDEAEAWKDRA